jgi:hypothetical protein
MKLMDKNVNMGTSDGEKKNRTFMGENFGTIT